jgi:predicted metal-dependent hydrolase
MEKIEKTIVIDGKDYQLNIFVEKRNNVRASLTNSGINIRLPRHMSTEAKNREGKKFLDWAVQKIREGASVKYEEKTYSHGDKIKVFGKEYLLDIEHRASTKNFTKLKENIIYFKVSMDKSEKEKREYISKQLKKILAKEHLSDLVYHVNRLNDLHFGERVNNVSFKYTTSHWGQCHTGLTHLVHPNHSKRFWARVKKADPFYKSKELWLSKNGDGLKI